MVQLYLVVFLEMTSDKMEENYPFITATEDELVVSELFYSLQGEGSTAGTPAVFLRLQGCNLRCGFCLHPNTKIRTLNKGLVKIKNIREGEELLTLDGSEKVIVTRVYKIIKRVRSVEDMMGLVIERHKSEPIVCSREHRFYIKNRGFIEARYIREGDVILSIDFGDYRMNNFNPMKDKDVSQRVGNTLKSLYKTGEIKPYERTSIIRESIAKKHLGELNVMKNPEVSRRNAINHYRGMSKLEESFNKFFMEENYDISYIGNNKLAIGDKLSRYRFPDFIVGGSNKLIEIYDTTFSYGQDKKLEFRGEKWKTDTTYHYKKFDKEVLFLTELDLKNKDELRSKLFNYIYNGKVVTKIYSSFNEKQKARLFGSASEEVIETYDLGCIPYHSYLVRDCLVHNCDTPTWHEGVKYSNKELIELFREKDFIKRIAGGTRIVCTGGEPLLRQKNLINFLELLNTEVINLTANPMSVEIETNGTILPTTEFDLYISQYNVSPKLANSDNKKELRIRPEVIEYLKERNSIFKFVIDKKEDLDAAMEDYIMPFNIDSSLVYLMPECVSKQELDEKKRMVFELCMEYGFNYSARHQVDIFNKTVGV